MNTSCILLFLAISFLQDSNGARIFISSYLPSGSHAIWFGKLAGLLGDRGHEVVLLSTGPYKPKSSNVTFILIEDAYTWIKDFEKLVEETSLIDAVGGFSGPIDNIQFTSDWNFMECEKLLNSQGTRSFINKYKNTHFDLIITDFICESFLGFVPFFGNPPFIIATPYNNAFNVHDSVGLFDNPSYVPMSFTPFTPEMNFPERALNLYYKIISMLFWDIRNIPNENVVVKKVFGDSTPSVSDIMRNVSLLMIGIDPVLTGAKPLPPSFIPVGGFHISKIKPLPQDLKTFLDDAKDGVIYFSFGSNFKSSFMTPEMINMFLDAFKELPQKVIWKLEHINQTADPDKLLISKWLPQNDILGHPNVRCFISHGGLLSTQEAIYHGVPLLIFPFMFDQIDLAEKIKSNGVGTRMEFAKLSKEYIKATLNKVMQPSYRKKMKEWSKIFRDTPQTAEERTIWWVEYVLRNPSETRKYLRSASMDLYWFQRLMLDVVAAAAVVIIIVAFSVLHMIRALLALCCEGRQKSALMATNKKKNN